MDETVTKTNGRPVIACTSYKGVFFGYTETDKEDAIGPTDTLRLKRARMAVYWGTTRGVMQLAETGPTAKSRISARADMAFTGVTAIFEVTPGAAEAWEAAP